MRQLLRDDADMGNRRACRHRGLHRRGLRVVLGRRAVLGLTVTNVVNSVSSTFSSSAAVSVFTVALAALGVALVPSATKLPALRADVPHLAAIVALLVLVLRLVTGACMTRRSVVVSAATAAVFASSFIAFAFAALS